MIYYDLLYFLKLQKVTLASTWLCKPNLLERSRTSAQPENSDLCAAVATSVCRRNEAVDVTKDGKPILSEMFWCLQISVKLKDSEEMGG